MSDRYIVSPHRQGTEGWLADRAGHLTGSISDVVWMKSNSKTRIDRCRQLARERVRGTPTARTFKESAAMSWGTDTEPLARMKYEAIKELDVSQSGYLYLKRLKAGCSVDGFVIDNGRAGFIEIKCPDENTHHAYMIEGVAPSDYMPQITHNLWITGVQFCDFMSFDPRAVEGGQVFIVRIERDEAAIKAYEAAAFQFLLEVDAAEKDYRQRIAANPNR